MGRRALAWALVLYGSAGLLLAVTGAVVGLDVASKVERLASDADGTLSAAADATRSAAESFGNVDASLANAEQSAAAASSLAADASGTLSSLAVAMEQLTLLGGQPLQALADEFRTSADQAGELAVTLDAVGGSLGDTRTDVTGVGVELDVLSDRLEELRGSEGATGSAPPVRLFVLALLAWLLLPALAAFVVGLSLLRRPVVVVAPTSGPPATPSPPA